MEFTQFICECERVDAGGTAKFIFFFVGAALKKPKQERSLIRTASPSTTNQPDCSGGARNSNRCDVLVRWLVYGRCAEGRL